MAQTQIHGETQIKSGTITTAQISATAALTDGQLATSYIKTDGSRAFTGNQSAGNNNITSLLAGTAADHAVNLAQLQAAIRDQDGKPSVAFASTGAETYTIAAGSVTQISGTTFGGGSPAVNDRLLIKNSPATTGSGTADSGTTGTSQPANGFYLVTNATTNLTVSRTVDGDGNSEVTTGATVWVDGGTFEDTQWTLITNPAITVGTTALQFTKTGGATVSPDGTSLTQTGNTWARAALTGDVTASEGSSSTTIANAAVSLAKMANLAANSVIGNLTGSSATPAAVSATSAATASTVATRDANANSRVNNAIENFQTVTSAAGTTTLTVSSAKTTQITGSTTQTVKLPDATTLVVGQQYVVVNRSSGAVTVNDNGSSLVQTMASGSFLTVTVTDIGSAAGVWDAAYTSAGGSGTVTTVSVASSNGFAGTVANASTTPAITMTTTITGVLKGNGTAISAATAGTDYLAPANFATRETPSGLVNGSNTTYVLANTPIAGSESVFWNGLLMEPGAGNDYTISGATITALSAPVSGDKLRVSYIY